MPLQIEQIIFTAFDDVGFCLVYSNNFPEKIAKFFRSKIVERHWNAYQPPPSGYAAAYFYQINHYDTLFGWLYDESEDVFRRKHLPYYLSYYYHGRLEISLVHEILNCLEKGPVELLDLRKKQKELPSLFIGNDASYIPARLGVFIPEEVKKDIQLVVSSGEMLSFFVPETRKNLYVDNEFNDDKVFNSRFYGMSKPLGNNYTVEEILEANTSYRHLLLSKSLHQIKIDDNFKCEHDKDLDQTNISKNSFLKNRKTGKKNLSSFIIVLTALFIRLILSFLIFDQGYGLSFLKNYFNPTHILFYPEKKRTAIDKNRRRKRS